MEENTGEAFVAITVLLVLADMANLQTGDDMRNFDRQQHIFFSDRANSACVPREKACRVMARKPRAGNTNDVGIN